MTLPVHHKYEVADQKVRIVAAAATVALHGALFLALIIMPLAGGATSGRIGLDHGDLIEISLSPIHQRAAAAAKDLGEKERTNLKGPRPVKVGHKELGDQLGRDTGPTNRDVTRAVTLEPNANDTMTDTAVLLYRDQLAAYLAKYREYPLDARRNHIEGTVYLHFIMSADGKVLSAWIVQSSGFASLDGEALSAIERAQPLPPIPPGWPRQLDVTIPISFELS